ncbi:Glycosyltransferase family 18 protein [Mycena venus]|uniref:Glycosyltransferase family 18 protein n=1 Tax=Mycena venus TaxID=2733690 RepID=A0A8H6Y1C9_9AGAR|nr:Glycosyltransferase family 18 protein [Mycena venus]
MRPKSDYGYVLVILASFHFLLEKEGHMAGEEIWARSTIKALANMGYTYLYSPHIEWTIQLYQMFPDLVKAILVEGEDSKYCFEDVDCIMNSENPYGLPAWKIFSFAFWVQSANPLGHKWTLSPEDYRLEHSWNIPNTYLGYSVEPGCLSTPFIPHEQRKFPPQIYILAKTLEYFNPKDHAWKADFYDDAANATGAQFVVGAVGSPPGDFSKSIKNVGLMPQKWFYQNLAQSSVLVGMGLPWTSPTPYDALCLGVPFINPIVQWDPKNKTNRDRWFTQQGSLKVLDPPYVYNVFKGDKEGFLQAIKDALANPIQPYILDRMRMSAIEERLGRILETDWKAEARVLLKQRQESGKGKLFEIEL